MQIRGNKYPKITERVVLGLAENPMAAVLRPSNPTAKLWSDGKKNEKWP
jgi:hypothetical protein